MSDDDKNSDALEDEGFTHRLETLVERLGGPVKAARVAGVSRQTLDQWRLGKSKVALAGAARLAKAAEISLDWLVEGRDTAADQAGTDAPVMKANPDELADGFVIVPQLKLEASAGGGRLALTGDLFKGDVVAFREDWLHSIGIKANRAELLTASGDSMEPTIRDGDLLLVDRAIDRVVSNGIYVLVFNGAVLVKRIIVRLDGSLILKSDNELYGEEAVPKDATSELIIEGRVRWHGKTV